MRPRVRVAVTVAVIGYAIFSLIDSGGTYASRISGGELGEYWGGATCDEDCVGLTTGCPVQSHDCATPAADCGICEDGDEYDEKCDPNPGWMACEYVSAHTCGTDSVPGMCSYDHVCDPFPGGPGDTCPAGEWIRRCKDVLPW
jgi:hypothetical protein